MRCTIDIMVFILAVSVCVRVDGGGGVGGEGMAEYQSYEEYTPPCRCICYDYTPLTSGYIFFTSGLRPSVKKIYPSVIGVYHSIYTSKEVYIPPLILPTVYFITYT